MTKAFLGILAAALICSKAASAQSASPAVVKIDPTGYAAKLGGAGKELGYATKVGSGEFGTIDASFVKIGTSPESHGLLGKKWDQRETIYVRYVPTASGDLTIASVKRVVEQKPPVGSWKIVTEDTEVPAELLAKLPLQ